MSKLFIFIFCFFNMAIALASLPEGVWLNKTPITDNGGYASYYRDWYVISDKNVDAVITLGAHYSKQKLQIQSDDGQKVKLLNLKARSISEISYSYANDTLQVCDATNGCREFVRTTETMLPDLPPSAAPEIQLVGKWCIDNDCQDVTYSHEESVFICNINSELTPYSTRYVGPTDLMKRYGLQIAVLIYAYRLDNENTLSSFSTSMSLQASIPFPRNIAQSGVQRLQIGVFSSMRGTIQGHQVSVTFSILQ